MEWAKFGYVRSMACIYTLNVLQGISQIFLTENYKKCLAWYCSNIFELKLCWRRPTVQGTRTGAFDTAARGLPAVQIHPSCLPSGGRRGWKPLRQPTTLDTRLHYTLALPCTYIKQRFDQSGPGHQGNRSKTHTYWTFN
jgi:hypothetical protein